MYLRNKKYLAIVVLLLSSFTVFAQVTTQSPYSKFGLGNLKGAFLPQNRAMGGIAAGVNTPTGFSYINPLNPATYSDFGITVVEAGLSGSFINLKKGAAEESSFNSTLSHFAIGFPVTPKSGISIGLLPYSELGYDFRNTGKVDTMNVDYVYQGEGGLSKAYLGYGYKFGTNLRVGVNLEYIFGNMLQSKSTEFLNQPTALNVKVQNKESVYGLNFSYGAQYDVKLTDKVIMTIGYAGSSSSNINLKPSTVVTRFTKDLNGNENYAIDTAQFSETSANKLKLPLTHTFGFSIQRFNKWMIGGDVRIGNWSDLSINNVNQGLQNTFGASIGGQFTPEINAVSGYFKRIDYRAGFQYEKTYIRVSNTDIKQVSGSIGFGFPFSSMSRYTFSKLNFTTEMGKRGTVSSNLVKESFINFHIGLTLNDKWFTRFKFD